MYIVENRVFFTCGKIEYIDEHIIQSNLKKFENIELEMQTYWFNRFNNGIDYLKFTIQKNNNDDWYDFNIDDNFKNKYAIESFIVKIHKNGITSTEVFFKLRDDNVDKFDEDIDQFSNLNTEKLFKIVFKLNEILSELGILQLSNTYKFGTLTEEDLGLNKFIPHIFAKNENNKNKNLSKMQDSYLLRVHRLLTNEDSYLVIQKKYSSNDTRYIECNVESNHKSFKGSLFWAFVLWYSEKTESLQNDFSNLLDIDTYTMNEIVVYNTAGYTYTDLMYEINLNSISKIKSTDLFEMYKVNGYFLQKNKLAELSFSENVNNFVTSQREIEKFKMQQETFLESEKKFHDVYNAVEANEKTSANRIVQYVLTALTLLTIVSVSKDIIEFAKAEFSNEHNVKIEFLTRTEVLVGILGSILILFFILKKIIKKI
ncbi:MAG: hypothetical protein FP820_07260 [Sulfurimonas sp.]|jgi:hypothetical protein|nr:hypothetical protein [Sulfurimonas sp.]MBU3938687.1 hypothetical protein [bacterium]MBU4024445.1 hypothetical protein [bacterium]MBU4060005.1 hypothetical protein [bacterium]